MAASSRIPKGAEFQFRASIRRLRYERYRYSAISFFAGLLWSRFLGEASWTKLPILNRTIAAMKKAIVGRAYRWSASDLDYSLPLVIIILTTLE